MELVARGRCSEAAPELESLSARSDGWGRAARNLAGRCAHETIRAAGSRDVEDWAEVVGRMRACLSEASDAPLPGGIEPVSSEELGRAVETLMSLHLEQGSHLEVLEVLEDNAGHAELTPAARALSGKARLALGRWARAASDLESAARPPHADGERADLLRLASGAWHLAGQGEKALLAFSRARRLAPLPWTHPERLIPEGREMEHVLGELIAAAVHGVLMKSFTTDWESMQDEPQKLNFFVFQKRDKALLEAEEEISTLGEVMAAGGEGQLAGSAPRLLYQILNMRALLRASGGDYGGARRDLEAALTVDPDGEEAAANLDLLAFWVYEDPD
jgi:tetratricopeptide (TPR) repeat protein